MIQNAYRRISEVVVANPGPSHVVALCSLVVAARAGAEVCRRGMAYWKRGEEGSEERDEPQGRFGNGAFLDGLAAVPPTMEPSACERLVGYVGFEVPAQQEAERNFAQLLRICRKLPATVDGAPWLQNHIDSLRMKVDLLSRTRYGVAERGDGLNAIDALWHEAVNLRKRLKIQHRRQACQPEMVNAATASSTSSRHSGAGKPDDDGRPHEPSGSQTVKRRHLAQANAETHRPPQPRQAEPFLLEETQRMEIRAAIAYAWRERDGRQRITENEQRRLGVAIAAITGGTYPTHFGHSGPQERRHTIQHVLLRATQRMTPWHRDAVRNVGEATLQDLALPA